MSFEERRSNCSTRTARLLRPSLRFGCWCLSQSPAPGPAQTQRPGSALAVNGPRGPWQLSLIRWPNPPWAFSPSVDFLPRSPASLCRCLSKPCLQPPSMAAAAGSAPPSSCGWGRGLAGGVPELGAVSVTPWGPARPCSCLEPNQPGTSPRHPQGTGGARCWGPAFPPTSTAPCRPRAPLSVHAPAPLLPGRGRIPTLAPQSPSSQPTQASPTLPPCPEMPFCPVFAGVWLCFLCCYCC